MNTDSVADVSVRPPPVAKFAPVPVGRSASCKKRRWALALQGDETEAVSHHVAVQEAHSGRSGDARTLRRS
mgnify:CR=1 FL=1